MKDRNRIPATKKELLVRLLDRGKVMIHLDARQEGVDVPEQYTDDADLRLNISYRFQYGDLAVSDSEVRTTLSFSGRAHTCRIPLDAVFAMFSHVSGESFFFPTDAPPEALAGFAALMAPLAEEEREASSGPRPGEETGPGAQSARPRLRAIDGGVGSTNDHDIESEPRSKGAGSATGEDLDEESDSKDSASTTLCVPEPGSGGADAWATEERANLFHDDRPADPSADEGSAEQEEAPGGPDAGADEEAVEEDAAVAARKRWGHLRVIK